MSEVRRRREEEFRELRRDEMGIQLSWSDEKRYRYLLEEKEIDKSKGIRETKKLFMIVARK